MDLTAKLILITIALGTLVAFFAPDSSVTVNVPEQENNISVPAPTVIVPEGFMAAYDSSNPNVSERAREIVREELSSSDIVTSKELYDAVGKVELSTVRNIDVSVMTTSTQLTAQITGVDSKVQGLSSRVDSMASAASGGDRKVNSALILSVIAVCVAFAWPFVWLRKKGINIWQPKQK